MNKNKLKGIVEGLLFTWGDPLHVNEIKKIIGLNKKETEEIIYDLIDDYNYENRGLRVVKLGDEYQIGTKPEYYDWIKKLRKQTKNKKLSNAALETLSIIAYKQPVIKSEIEFIRGVKSDKAISTLMEHNLIEEQGRLDKTGRPILYGTTSKFLRVFSLESLEDLPELKDIDREKIEREVLESKDQ